MSESQNHPADTSRAQITLAHGGTGRNVRLLAGLAPTSTPAPVADENHHRDPWEFMHQEMPHVSVRYRWLRPGLMGYTEWSAGQPAHIVLARGIGADERRVTLAHEMHHVLAGAPTPGAEDDSERRVRRATAEWLLPDAGEVGDVLRRRGLTEAAAVLRVTVDVLLDRLHWASDEELDTIADWQPADADAATVRT